jgi:hypothetical protein
MSTAIAGKLTPEDLARYRALHVRQEGYNIRPDAYSVQEIEQNELAMIRLKGEMVGRYDLDDLRLWNISAYTGVIIYGEWDED